MGLTIFSDEMTSFGPTKYRHPIGPKSFSHDPFRREDTIFSADGVDTPKEAHASELLVG